MRRAARVDANQASIVLALRCAGAKVQHLHALGAGCPDLLVAYRGGLWLMEIKVGDAGLTDDERAWHDDWREQAGACLVIVRSADEALRTIGAA